jgi:hypothetical protein
VKYRVYFYSRSQDSPREHFASPEQEFHSLEEARTFAKDAANAATLEKAYSFRIETDDRTVSEYWTRDDGDWNLEPEAADIPHDNGRK